MPANRGIVSTGLYRLVRHPIYMGYLITHAGFVAANPTLWNVVMLVGADLALMWRAVCEEQTLSQDAATGPISRWCGGGWCRACSEKARTRVRESVRTARQSNSHPAWRACGASST